MFVHVHRKMRALRTRIRRIIAAVARARVCDMPHTTYYICYYAYGNGVSTNHPAVVLRRQLRAHIAYIYSLHGGTHSNRLNGEYPSIKIVLRIRVLRCVCLPMEACYYTVVASAVRRSSAILNCSCAIVYGILNGQHLSMIQLFVTAHTYHRYSTQKRDATHASPHARVPQCV